VEIGVADIEADIKAHEEKLLPFDTGKRKIKQKIVDARRTLDEQKVSSKLMITSV
jgi:hypothetical protein